MFESKQGIMNKMDGDSWNQNVAYKIDDMTFIFYTELKQNLIRVFWNNFDSKWDDENYRTMKRRFNKYFGLD